MIRRTSNHLPRKGVMSTHNPFIEYYRDQALGKQQTGYGFYTGLPWQRGYGIGGLLGAFARQFVPILKPLAQAAGKKLLHAGASFVSDIIDGKPVGAAARGGLKKFIEVRNTKTRRNGSGDIPKIRNKRRRRNDSGITPKKRRRGKQDIFS